MQTADEGTPAVGDRRPRDAADIIEVVIGDKPVENLAAGMNSRISNRVAKDQISGFQADRGLLVGQDFT